MPVVLRTATLICSSSSSTRFPAIKQRLDNLLPLLDVDGNGLAEAQTDGLLLLLLLLLLFGLRGDALTAGIAATGATRIGRADRDVHPVVAATATRYRK